MSWRILIYKSLELQKKGFPFTAVYFSSYTREKDIRQYIKDSQLIFYDIEEAAIPLIFEESRGYKYDK